MTTPPQLLSPPLLEEWYRQHLTDAAIDISSSGVSPYTFRELQDLTGLDLASLDPMLVDDSESFGLMGLREAVAQRYAGGRAEHVMATHGSSEAIFLVLSALCAPGTKVVCVDPAYHSLANVPARAGATIVPLPLQLFVGDEPDWDGVEAVVSTDTDVLVVNFPHNPTGVTLTPDGVDRLIEIARRSNAFLVWDAAFEHLTTDVEIPGDLGLRYPRSVVFGTLSKAFGLPGLRVGWAIAPPSVLQHTLALHDSTTLFLSPLVERLAQAAVIHAPRLVEPRLERAMRNRETLAAWVAAHDKISWSDPAAGVSALVTFDGVTDIEEFCLALLRTQGVLLVPGTAFGRSNGTRLGFGGDPALLSQGLDLLGLFFEERSR